MAVAVAEYQPEKAGTVRHPVDDMLENIKNFVRLYFGSHNFSYNVFFVFL